MKVDLKTITDSVDELSVRGKITRERAFAAWFAINFCSIDEDDALESAAADGGNDQGIDIVFADDSTEEIFIIQAHCPSNTSKVTPKDKWNAVTAAMPYVDSPDLLVKIGRPDLAELLAIIKTTHKDYQVNIGLISLGLRSNQIVESLNAHNDSPKSKEYNFFYFPQEELLAKFKVLMESEGGIPSDELHFEGGHFEDSGAYGRAWIGSVTAVELKRLYAEYSDTLFAGNIRLFLGSRKGGINEQIMSTAKDAPGNFWALNNGVTIVADTVTPKKGSTSTLALTRFSIVNGCQTTSCLAKGNAGKGAKVLARVIAAKASLRNEIVRYNNSQNAIKIWTVRAVDDVQQELRKEFEAEGIDYAPKQQGSRRTKKADTIVLDRVSQYLASSQQQLLIQAINNKSELFDQPYQKIFRRGIKAPEVYLAWLIGNASDSERQSLIDGLGEDENSGLLGVTSSYWITYCAYKLIKKFTDMNSVHITLKAMRSVDFQNATRKYVKEAATMFYDAAVDTYERDEYGSFKSTLRSTKFLSKVDSKVNSRIARTASKALPDLVAVCKTIKPRVIKSARQTA